MTASQTPHDEEAMKVILDNIQKSGCHISSLEGDGYMPPVVFSIGLFKAFGHPELICFGLDTNLMASPINKACDGIREPPAVIPLEAFRPITHDQKNTRANRLHSA